MNVRPFELRIRLLLATGLVVVLTSVYVRALAMASVFGTFSGMVRPWQHLGADLALFGLAAASVVCLVPVVAYGRSAQRIIGSLLMSLPLLVVGHFVIWLILDYVAWRG